MKPSVANSSALRQRLSDALARTLGREQAERALREHAKKLSVDLDTIIQDQALQLLESLTSEPGIVGITARFAKARMYLEP
jgi:hypothetical protein